MKRTASLFLAVFVVVFVGAFMRTACAQTNPCTYIGPSATSSITGPDGVCKKITNNNGSNNLCVMTGTTAQWQSFYNNPNEATVAACSSCGTAGQSCLAGHPACCTGLACNFGTCAVGPGSDIRLKKNIAELPDEEGLDAIMKLRPVTWQWRDVDQARAEGDQIGFIAQEIGEVLPRLSFTIARELTIHNGDGSDTVIENVKGVDYQKIVVPLVKAVQELKAQNDKDRAAEEAQAAEIKALKARLQKLEASRH